MITSIIMNFVILSVFVTLWPIFSATKALSH